MAISISSKIDNLSVQLNQNEKVASLNKFSKQKQIHLFAGQSCSLIFYQQQVAFS